jgi:hydro-lyases, Fe-S type, tartrate/fumarate subfamily, alpha region/hydro-lyases, Fe-S type, tartrate/fumarate subfamily, beta region
MLVVEPEALTVLTQHALRDASFLLRREHNEMVAKILSDPEASENDKYVALTMLRNAEVSAKGQLPICQDTGTAIVMGKKGQQVWTGANDEGFISKGVYNTYTQENLRYSQNAPLNMYEEVNTGTNLPAQIDLYATQGDEYKFLFVCKGGGSANKTYLYQETKALLNPKTLVNFLVEKMKTLGTAACPPYHIAFVIGGTSAETNLKTVKLASTKYYDELPTQGNELGQAFRDVELEKELLKAAHELGLGAQFGGKYYAHDVRVVRLSRHGASCPVGMGVSCSADRNIKAKINEQGLWIEKMDDQPATLIPEEYRNAGEGNAVKINLNQPMNEILKELSKYPVSTRLSLNGTIIVGRDIAHAKIKERLDAGLGMPEYLKNHPIYYAGPAKTPEGMPSGSFGPTTAGRMDSYVDQFQSEGGSMIMIAKGNRSQQVTDACQKHGGFYLGSIGGPAAILAQNNIKKVECLEYPELGMEAIWKIEVENFPAFILVDDKGNDFFKQIKPTCPGKC